MRRIFILAFLGAMLAVWWSGSRWWWWWNSTSSSMNNNVVYLNNEPLEYNTDTKFTARSKPLTRKKYIEAIQSLTDEQPAIVLHHDTISEGLNVPGFTCFIPFSDTLMNFVKLYQFILVLLPLAVQ